MKFIARTVAILLVVNLLLIYMHYKQAEDVIAKEPETLMYHQEIEVINRQDALYVRHHFSGLPQRRLEIVWPEVSVERSCYPVTATSCDYLDDNLTAFLDENNGQQSLSYKISKEGSMQQAALFLEPFASLHGATATSTLFHMTDETGIGGMWVNGLEQVGAKKMDLIDYAFFNGSGEVKDLYWQQNSVPLLYEGERLTVYGEKGDAGRFKAFDKVLKDIGASHLTIVMDHTNIAVQSQRFVVTGNEDIDQVIDQSFRSAMHAHFSIPQNERLIAEVMASILGNKATGTEQSRQAYEKLIAALTVEELERLKESLSHKSGQKMNASVLDDMIGKVVGLKTSFFTTTLQDEVADYPFLFEDTREFQVDGTSQAGIRIIVKDGKVLYPAKAILSLADYSFTTNEQSIYIVNDSRQFRFPKKELFYVYNDRKFDVITAPFEVIAGEVYFEENWFKRLFLFKIEKTADTIDIVNLT
ncbi:hypothetical protein [Sporosarcina sp. NPDC096371]|uniref:hypothetical protein n=1 Tax=Sporosarcina sp. NPDC096371 TaxID=3364530 RepID=UPI0037FD7FD7